jgi:hypothetical protein
VNSRAANLSPGRWQPCNGISRTGPRAAGTCRACLICRRSGLRRRTCTLFAVKGAGLGGCGRVRQACHMTLPGCPVLSLECHACPWHAWLAQTQPALTLPRQHVTPNRTHTAPGGLLAAATVGRPAQRAALPCTLVYTSLRRLRRLVYGVYVDSLVNVDWALAHTHTHTAQHSTAQHSTAQHSTAQHSTAQHSTAQHSTAQHSTAQH